MKVVGGGKETWDPPLLSSPRETEEVTCLLQRSLGDDGRDDVKRVGYSLTYDDAIFHWSYKVIQGNWKDTFFIQPSLFLYSFRSFSSRERERERESEILFRISREFPSFEKRDNCLISYSNRFANRTDWELFKTCFGKNVSTLKKKRRKRKTLSYFRFLEKGWAARSMLKTRLTVKTVRAITNGIKIKVIFSWNTGSCYIRL